jgi:hypothetical protein
VREKLNSDFTTVCLLNALFGDARVHLVQLHPSYSGGVSSSKRAAQLARSRPFNDIKESFETQKIRRNAVTEVLRFSCLLGHPSGKENAPNGHPDLQTLYADALNHLVCGNPVSAVRLLNKNNQQSVSLLVSQAISSQDSVK